jgi:hypothetical protein
MEGNILISIVSEPKDEIYRALLTYLGTTCDKFSLTLHDPLMKHYDMYDFYCFFT